MSSSEFIFDAAETTFEHDVVSRSYETPIVVDFWAPWCGPCKTLGPILEMLAQECAGSFLLAKVNVDENPGLAVRFGVQGIPSVKAYRNGEIIAEFNGSAPERTVREFIQKIAPSETDTIVVEATSLLAIRQWAQAEEQLRIVLDSQPHNSVATLGLVRALIAQGKGNEAIAFINDFPAGSEIVAAQQLKPLAQLLAEVEEATKKHTEHMDALQVQYGQAAKLLARGQHAAAMDGLLEVIRYDKNFRQGEPKLVILAVFALLGEEDPLTREYRDELASILF
jgi:putative thioredoxin|tara:strand:+ start:6977 stop:7819 length:843 start_codon:yes stop_codon:yes gene_type:complete